MTVVITGAAGGIGAGIARGLAAAGLRLVLVDRNETALAELAAGLPGAPLTVAGDVADPDTHARAAAAADEGLWGWVNCAGITLRVDLHDLDGVAARRLVEVNQLGTLWGTAAAVRSMVGRGGSIVNISSVHARAAYAGYGVYEMTKAAIEALTRSAAVAYGADGIRVNAVAPGAVETPALTASFDSAPDPDGARRHVAGFSALGRVGSVEDVASAVAFLLSDQADYITGHTLTVDGGWTAVLGRDSSDPSHVRTRGGSE
ncbi:SDR family NAD(P)-dependent oxidoreductase [Microbacterium sp.]|uniref:SDR family NAD(P)-dependent oxidoreductase n=1 Tax=Microbacterium sp. TaxID=51671 RepID=UPI0039E44AF1